MYIAYADESGDAGAFPGGSQTFTLACVFLEAIRWPEAFDDLIEFRRFLRDRFGLPVRAEVKANYVLHNRGPFRKLMLSESARFAIFRGFMRLHAKLSLQAFAIVIRKDAMAVRGRTEDPRDQAWSYLLQRLERLTIKSNMPMMLTHDEGEGHVARKLTRKARRMGGAGSMFGEGKLRLPARLILDDPVPRPSHESYFVQLADLDAYAAFRRLYPPPAGRGVVVPQSMWDELGEARYSPANLYSGGPPGIVAWP